MAMANRLDAMGTGWLLPVIAAVAALLLFLAIGVVVPFAIFSPPMGSSPQGESAVRSWMNMSSMTRGPLPPRRSLR